MFYLKIYHLNSNTIIKKILGYNIDISIMSINFSSLKSGIAGTCYSYTAGSQRWKEIKIDINNWNRSNAYTRQALLYHELAHCVLGRGHENVTYIGKALSLMNKTVISGTLYHRHEYNYELFTKD